MHTDGTSGSMRRRLTVLCVAALALGAVATFSTGADAGTAVVVPTAVGEFTCNPDGSATITWTLTKNLSDTNALNIGVASVTGAVSTTVQLTPSQLTGPGTDTATGETAVPPGVTGLVIVAIPWTWSKTSGTAAASVTVDCTPPAPAPAAAVAAAADFTG
jgi:hypothetical protein